MWRKSHKFNFRDEPPRTSKTSKQPSKQFLEHAGDSSDASLETIDVFDASVHLYICLRLIMWSKMPAGLRLEAQVLQLWSNPDIVII